MKKEGNKVIMTENELKGLVKSSVKKILRESYNQFTDGEGLGWSNADYDESDGNYDGMYSTKYGPVTLVNSKGGDFAIRGPKVGEILGYNAEKVKNEIDRLVFCKRSTIEDAVDQAVTQFCNKYYRHGAVNEGQFDSKEDMTQYRDMYAPDTENSGPYANHRHTIMDDGYDYCGDDCYNDEVDDYNDTMRNKLATKGGQMDFDWGNRYHGIGGNKTIGSIIFQHGIMNRMQDTRRDDNERWHRAGEKKRNKWVDGKYDTDEIDLGMYDFEPEAKL